MQRPVAPHQPQEPWAAQDWQLSHREQGSYGPWTTGGGAGIPMAGHWLSVHAQPPGQYGEPRSPPCMHRPAAPHQPHAGCAAHGPHEVYCTHGSSCAIARGADARTSANAVAHNSQRCTRDTALSNVAGILCVMELMTWTRGRRFYPCRVPQHMGKRSPIPARRPGAMAERRRIGSCRRLWCHPWGDVDARRDATSTGETTPCRSDMNSCQSDMMECRSAFANVEVTWIHAEGTFHHLEVA